MLLQAPKGTQDLLPDQVPLWRHIEESSRAVLERFGYAEIRPPMMEYTGLFQRAVGEVTDIVQKEMYTFGSDAPGKEDTVTLRPELTAPVVRACLENSLFAKKPFQKLYYLGPLFRHENVQKGRLRQFHQVGVEALGSYDPLLDVETIELACALLDGLGLDQYEVRLNSIGCPLCRQEFRATLKAALAPRLSGMCPNCNARFERNVFRVLDCKEEKCRAATAGLPSIQEHLCGECKEHFGKLRGALDGAKLKWALDPRLVRGFDYYTKTVYELTYPTLGAQNAIGGGGRYDGLVEELGGPKTGAVGFAIGLERVLIALTESGKAAEWLSARERGPEIFLCTVTAEDRVRTYALLRELRARGLAADVDFEGRGHKAQMRTANKLGARLVAVLGPDEFTKGSVKLKDMATGTEREVPLAGLADAVRAAPAVPSAPAGA
ncbi:MAG: histidine--tRNA ligase [Planctomycetes bacterium]|nr:histidine--tRNA ligase [Planctomycetota bacterium]